MNKSGNNIVFYSPSKMCVGKNVYFAYGYWLSTGAEITISDEVTIGPYSLLASSNHSRLCHSYFNTGAFNAPIQIGEGCWLSAHCAVTAGCEIGFGSVLGAEAIVVDNNPFNVMAGGVLAKIIKYLESEKLN
jgi:maltose O-acetyltransferase